MILYLFADSKSELCEWLHDKVGDIRC